MGVEPIAEENLRVGKAVLDDWDKNRTIVSLDASFEDNAPLWYYVLAETLIGMLWADGHSYLRQAPNWQPETIRSMGDLINFALS